MLSPDQPRHPHRRPAQLGRPHNPRHKILRTLSVPRQREITPHTTPNQWIQRLKDTRGPSRSPGLSTRNPNSHFLQQSKPSSPQPSSTILGHHRKVRSKHRGGGRSTGGRRLLDRQCRLLRIFLDQYRLPTRRLHPSPHHVGKLRKPHGRHPRGTLPYRVL